MSDGHKMVKRDPDPNEDLYWDATSGWWRRRPAPPEIVPATPLPADSLGRMEFLLASAIKALETGQKQGDARVVLASIREARGCLELSARISGELAQASLVAIQVNQQAELDSADMNAAIEAVINGLRRELPIRLEATPASNPSLQNISQNEVPQEAATPADWVEETPNVPPPPAVRPSKPRNPVPRSYDPVEVANRALRSPRRPGGLD